jgi:O-antigen ligase
MNTIRNYQADESAESRLFIWQVVWRLFKQHPLTGGGLHATGVYYVINMVARLC